MKVLLTLWITAVLVQEVVPSSLVRLPRQSGKPPQSTVHTEYVAQYQQKGSRGNDSFSTVKGKQEIVHNNCGDNWNSFAEKCAGLIKDLISSLANAVSSQPGEATNLQLHIKNSFKHFDSTHNCSCFNHTTCKDLSDIDLSSLFKNITIETSPLKSNCEDYSDSSLGDDKSGDPINTSGSGDQNRQLGGFNQRGPNVQDEDLGTDPTNKNNRQTNGQSPGAVDPTGSPADPFADNYSPPPLPQVNHGRGSFPEGITPGPNQAPFEYSAVSVSPPFNKRPPPIAPNNYDALPAIPDVLPEYPSPPPAAQRPYPVPVSPQPENTDSEDCDTDTPQSGQGGDGQPNQSTVPPVIPSDASGQLAQPNMGQNPLYPGLSTTATPAPNYPPPVNGQLGQPNMGQDPLYPGLITSPPPQMTPAPVAGPDYDDQLGQPNTGYPDSATPLPPSLGPVIPNTQPTPGTSETPCNDCDDDSGTTPTVPTGPGVPVTNAGSLPNGQIPMTPPPTVAPINPPTSDDQLGSSNTPNDEDCSSDSGPTTTLSPSWPLYDDQSPNAPGQNPVPTTSPQAGGYPTPVTSSPVSPPTSDSQNSDCSDCSDSNSDSPQDGSSSPTPAPYYPPPANGQLGSPNTPSNPDQTGGYPAIPVTSPTTVAPTSTPVSNLPNGGYPSNALPVTPPPVLVPTSPPTSDNQSGSPNDQNSDCSECDDSSQPTTIPYPPPSNGQLGSPNAPTSQNPLSSLPVTVPTTVAPFPSPAGGYPSNVTPPPVVAPASPTTSDNQLGSPNDQDSDCSDPDSSSDSPPQDGASSPIPYYPPPSSGQLGSPTSQDPLSSLPVTVPTTVAPFPSPPGGYPSNVTPPPVVAPASPTSSDNQLGSPNDQDSDCSDEDGSSTPTPIPYYPSPSDGQLGSPNSGPGSNPTTGPATPTQGGVFPTSVTPTTPPPTVIPYYPTQNGQLGSPNVTPVPSNPTTGPASSPQSGGYPTNAIPVTSPTTVPPYMPPLSGQSGQPNLSNDGSLPVTPVTTPSPSSGDDDCDDDTTTQPTPVVPSSQTPLVPGSTSPPVYPAPSTGPTGQSPSTPVTIAPTPFTTRSPAGYVTPSPTVAPSSPLESSGQLGQPNSRGDPASTPSQIPSVTPTGQTTPGIVVTDPTAPIPAVTPVATATTPALPSSIPTDQSGTYPDETFLQPTTFQTTSVEPTPSQISNLPPITDPIVPPSSGYPSQDSDKSLPQRLPTTPSRTTPSRTTQNDSDDEDDEEDCCSCESCTEEDEVKSPQQFRATACKDLEEARRELKAIFDKIKKKLKCGRRTSTTISSTSPL